MFEVEMKFRLEDVEDFQRRLREEFRLEFGSEQVEEDLYFQRESRDFRETGEALRIRRIGDRLRITYKGPRRDQVTKMREEIELPLFFPAEELNWSPQTSEPGGSVEESQVENRKQEWIRLLTRLGYRPFASVTKKRRTGVCQFEGRTFNVTFDHLDELGDFTEIETLVDSDATLADARIRLILLAARLDLKNSIRSSYLTLLLLHQGGEEAAGNTEND